MIVGALAGKERHRLDGEQLPPHDKSKGEEHKSYTHTLGQLLLCASAGTRASEYDGLTCIEYACHHQLYSSLTPRCVGLHVCVDYSAMHCY